MIKLKSYLLVFAVGLSITSSANANDIVMSTIVTNDTKQEATAFDDITEYLTYDDFSQAYETVINQDDFDSLDMDELDNRVREVLVEIYQDKITYSHYLPDDYYKLNPKERALVKKHPFMAAIVYNCSKIANNRAREIYSTGAHNGNQDAFRHSYWNALLASNLAIVYNGGGEITLNLNQGLGFAEQFATAHEYGVDKALEVEMDLYNNRQGRIVYRDYFNPSRVPSNSDLSDWVESRVDRGVMKRILNDTVLILTDNSEK